MTQIEQNIINSFRLAKSDIIAIQKAIIDLEQSHEAILKKLAAMEKRQGNKTVTKIVTKKAPVARKTFVASKEGKKFHNTNCPFAQNIKPKTKLSFKTKTKALNLGYKPCTCIK